MVAMLATAGIATAQSSSEKFNAGGEMRDQMSLIVNGLGLQPVKIQELGQMMERNRLRKESLLQQLDQIKEELVTLELNKEKEIQGMLTEDQWAKYQSEIKPQLDQNRAEQMRKLEE